MAHEEEICTRISESVKMAGFLEKKGRMKIVSAWKKYWFVLEERLLLYYRSQIEYINLSPCRGSLNMGLVTTVRPGSSSGPCIIHVVTRTQVVQLRAKNRATQEEWMQALLDSMSLPLFCKTLKTPLIADLHGHRYSLDNIHTGEREKPNENDRSNRYQGFDYRKKDMSDQYYGGSLDTVGWSKKFRNVQSTSPNISKGKMMEKILGYVEEIDSKSTSDMLSLIDDDGSGSFTSLKRKKRFADENMDFPSEEVPSDKTSFATEKLDNNNTHDYYGTINKPRRSLSDNEMNKTILMELDRVNVKDREESQFNRIKNAMRKTRDKAFKNKSESDGKQSAQKKRKESFLKRVFKRHHKADTESNVPEDESDMEDPLYDTIQDVQEHEINVISSTSDCSLKPKEDDEVAQHTEDLIANSISDDNNEKIQSNDAETQKPIFGSKCILPAQAMWELKSKLKSMENIAFQCSPKSDDISEKGIGKDEKLIPDLPPRRRSFRPKSPWHDVPTNNTPVGAAEANVNVHPAAVKFHDDIPSLFEGSTRETLYRGTESQQEWSTTSPEEEKPGKPKATALSVLLEQLTLMTTSSLAMSDSSLDSDKFWEKPRMERRFSDPDYDVPRPHKPDNLCISDSGEKSESDHYCGKTWDVITVDHSDSSCSFQSMEPDSLESAGKKRKNV